MLPTLRVIERIINSSKSDFGIYHESMINDFKAFYYTVFLVCFARTSTVFEHVNAQFWDLTLLLFTFYNISKACFWQNVILIFHYNLELSILEKEIPNSSTAKMCVLWNYIVVIYLSYHLPSIFLPQSELNMSLYLETFDFPRNA